MADQIKGDILIENSFRRVLFGTALYEEYQPDDHLHEDMLLLKNAHMNVVRVGEGSWSHWEPEDGVFSLGWLQPILDEAWSNDISTIIGMPTFALPQWLVRKYPEVALRDECGNRRFFGGREEHSLSHPVFRWYAERICRAIVQRYAKHPSVIGWQLHNEPGLWINYSPDAFEGYKDWLRHRYKTVERLNKEWGLTYWSHELSTWDDLWRPEGNVQPQYDIEWRRYQSETTDDLLSWQKNIIHELGSSGQIITVNYALGREAINEVFSSKHLDKVGVDPYYLMQDGFAMPAQVARREWPTVGPWSIALTADRAYSLKQQPFWVMETNAGPIDGSSANYPGYDGQWRQAAWQMIARGADMIEYWHWQQLHYGTETYWGGILPHDRQPGRVYEQLAALGAELEQANDLIVDLIPDYDITMLYSVQSRWGLSCQPHTRSEDGNLRNPSAYDDLFSAFYEGAFVSGRQVRLVSDEWLLGQCETELAPTEFVARHPVLVVPGLYAASQRLLSWLARYARAGGCLIIGPRTAYADDLARPFLERKPAYLAGSSGVSYQEYSNLDVDMMVNGTGKMAVRERSAATKWIDCLTLDDGDVLAYADHPHFSRFPLVTARHCDSGTVITVGTVPNTSLAASIYDYAFGNTDDWIGTQSHVSHSSATNRHGDRVHFLFNWSWEKAEVVLPTICSSLMNSDSVETISLGAWDVVVLRESLSE